MVSSGLQAAKGAGDRGESASRWKLACQLDSSRKLVSGAWKDLAGAIRNAADLRIQTAFRHNEHIDTRSKNPELIDEVAEFAVTYLVEDRWTAGIMTLRQPISLPDDFGPRPSMSFFMYNQDGRQAIARPYLDGGPAGRKLGPSPVEQDPTMPKDHQLDSWDRGTNAPSNNFIWDFEIFKFWVRDDWSEVLSHNADGKILSGSVGELARQFRSGCEVKVAVAGLCSDLDSSGKALHHQVFVKTGSCYYYTEQNLFIAGSHPLVRVKPGIPMQYSSKGWDFGWIIVRTDGLVVQWRVDPYTLKFQKVRSHHPIRWFVR